MCVKMLLSIKHILNRLTIMERMLKMKANALPHNHSHNENKVLESLPSTENCRTAADIFKQLSDGTRLRILWLLCHCEECVCNIAAAMEMSDPAVSHHLRTLKNTGLIVSRRDGKETYYKLADTKTADYVHHICEEIFNIACPLD